MTVELMDYIHDNILPLYNRNDKGHQLWHIKGVIERSLNIAKNYNVNLEMVYTIAAFHDIGCHINRENHEIESAQIFVNDKKMKEFFCEEQIIIIKEAIEDHRASLKYEHTSIYGKIIATADKFITIDDILKSIHLYTLDHFFNQSWNEMVERCYQYLNKKYGENGYANPPLVTCEYSNFLKEIRILLRDKELLNSRLKTIDIELKKEYFNL